MTDPINSRQTIPKDIMLNGQPLHPKWTNELRNIEIIVFFKNMFDKLLDNNDDDSEPVPNITSIGKSQHTPSTSKSSSHQSKTNCTSIKKQAIDIIQNLESSYEVDDTSTDASYIGISYPDNSIKKKEERS